jgi:proteic killer suppression protein
LNYQIELSRTAQKQLRRVPLHIVLKLKAWVSSVHEQGLERVRSIPGFHDELLKGTRSGQRSIRLSRSYRAIYALKPSGSDEMILVLEVTKHVY